MRRKICSGVIVSLLALHSVVYSQANKHAQLLIQGQAYDYIPDQVIVTLHETEGVNRQQLAEQLRIQVGASASKRLFKDFIYRLDMPAGSDVLALCASLQSQPQVRFANPNMLFHTTVDPNDTQYSAQWGFPMISAAQAWDIRSDASSVVVAVIDTGVQTNHPDLAANIWVNPGEIADNGIDDDRNGFKDDINGWDFYSNDKTATDQNGHGSHVAGTIGAVTNNGTGVAGMAWQVQIMSLRFLDPFGFGSMDDAISSIDYALANGARIASNSWGCECPYDVVSGVYAAIQNAGIHGMLSVIAAGNEAKNSDSTPFYPASFPDPSIISVAASTSSDQMASFSNWGFLSVDLAAPGKDITSTWLGSTYNTISGTSMATPHVSGAAALLMAQCPGLTAQEVKQALLNQVDKVAAFSLKVNSGGRLNLLKALQNACSATPANIVYVDITNNGVEDGTQQNPFNTVLEGINAVAVGGEVIILQGNYPETLTGITKQVILTTSTGSVTIGY